MPLDGRNFPIVETKPDLSLQSLLRFCESKPADEAYCFQDTGHCLFAQWFRDIGVPFISIGGISYANADNSHVPLPTWRTAAATRMPHTFGAAASRIRALLATRTEAAGT